MKDRLEELQNGMNKDDASEFEETLSFDNPVYQENETSAINTFFKEVSELLEKLKKLDESSQKIEQKQGQVLCSTTGESISEGKKELSSMKNAFTCEAQLIQSRLQKMKVVLVEDSKHWMAEYRIRQNQFMVLTNRYRNIITQHYMNETKYVGKLKEQIMRQADLAGLILQEDDINRLVESPRAPQIVGKDLEVLKAKQHLAMAQERHRQLLDLESQITELHTLFLHLEILVSEQQELINSIEYNVLQTMDYISQSNEQVKRAVKYERQSRVAAAVSAVLGFCACCTCLSCAAGAVR
ncbi:syntaxin-1B-like [Microcaecilia unicolor]|uniref:Syntaxin-1B-like n=1 Tax=Microcaecilia unicolor TaxID=1415580 RepID=A0A6P7YK96_9AMPH|nr:syntaxin-1B-like [Microcaecilia unicolor]